MREGGIGKWYFRQTKWSRCTKIWDGDYRFVIKQRLLPNLHYLRDWWDTPFRGNTDWVYTISDTVEETLDNAMHCGGIIYPKFRNLSIETSLLNNSIESFEPSKEENCIPKALPLIGSCQITSTHWLYVFLVIQLRVTFDEKRTWLLQIT
jgi:hypothetical protein